MKKTAIIVGAGKGLGNAIAREFAAHNFRVVLIARNEAHLNAYKKSFENEGIETYIKVADALHPDTLVKALQEIIKEFAMPDVFVYNVANTEPDNEREITNELLMQRFQSDVASAYVCANVLDTKEFADKKGAILLTGGGFAKTFKPILFLKPLCINKAALNALNIILHESLKDKGIFVGSVLVNGVIDENDKRYKPSLIAKEFYKMYEDRSEYEVLY